MFAMFVTIAKMVGSAGSLVGVLQEVGVTGSRCHRKLSCHRM